MAQKDKSNLLITLLYAAGALLALIGAIRAISAAEARELGWLALGLGALCVAWIIQRATRARKQSSEGAKHTVRPIRPRAVVVREEVSSPAVMLPMNAVPTPPPTSVTNPSVAATVAVEKVGEPCWRCGTSVGFENHCPVCGTYLGRDNRGTSGATIGGGDSIRIRDDYVYIPPKRGPQA
jgi:hypothetical protein